MDKKSFMTSAPCNNAIKLFTAINYEFSEYIRVFVPRKPFQYCILFGGKARAYPIETLFTLG